MSLSTALDTAKSSLTATQTQTAIIARNIANVNTVGATKKYANVVTGALGQVQVSSITQSSNAVLYSNMLEANSAVGKGNVISNGLTRISETIGDTALSRSPAAMVSAMNDALSTLAASPNNYELARNAATAASDLVTRITESSATVQSVRRDADAELVQAAADMTKILATIEDLNNRIVAGTRSGADTTDLNDARDQAVVQLSAYVGVTTLTRGNNDLVIFTDSGVTMFESTARKVEYAATGGLNATVTEGNAFRIDGTAVTGSNAFMPIKSGIVAGLVSLRDDLMVTYQTQLDEMARGLIDAFKEVPGGDIATGLFDATGISAPASADIGTYNPGTIAAGDSLTFDFVYGDKSYRATAAFTAAPTSAANFQATLQAAVNAATTVDGNAALPAGAVVTVGNANGALSLSSQTSGALGVSVSNIQTYVASKTGGLTAATTAAGSIAVGSFAAGTIAAGDKIAFTFSYGGVDYSASHTFTAVPTDTDYANALSSAIAAAVPVTGGAALGAGKVTAGTAGLPALTLTATNPATVIGLSDVKTVPANLATHTGGLTAGASSTTITGLAAQLKLATGVTADPTLIRDGVHADYNTQNAGGFTTRLNQLSDALNAARSFSATSGADPTASLADYAASSISWLQATRQTALSDTDYKQTVLDQTQATLSNETGINMDEQLTRMLELERSFQAASKLISTIDEMLNTLLNSI
jgi:flagellar hook-associated protein 1 FlgK